MKTYKNLYEPMLDETVIRKCFKQAAKHKSLRRDVRAVLNDLDRNVEVLKRILEKEEFLPSYHVPKVICEPSCKKKRRIVKPNYKYEQVVGHCVISQFKQVVLDGLYEFACGSIPGRGCHLGAKWVRKWIGGYNGQKFYVLKMDIRHFFDSIDRLILKQMLCKKIKDDRFIRLMFVMIEYDKIAGAIHVLDEAGIRTSWECKKELATKIAYDLTDEADSILKDLNLPEKLREQISAIIHEKHLGVPLGYYTSQWFGNFILKDLDHWIKQELKAEHYIRYMDDMVVFGKNKRKLHKMRAEIDNYLQGRLHLRLKDNWQVFRFEYDTGEVGKNSKKIFRGRMLDFMGFQFHVNRTTLRKSTLCRARRKAKQIGYKLQTSGKISWFEATQMLSYMGSIDAADVYDYYTEYIKPTVNVKKLKKIVSKHSRRTSNGYKLEADRGNARDEARTA